MLDGSLAFGPSIRAGIAAAAGITVDDPAFPALYAQFTFAAQNFKLKICQHYLPWLHTTSSVRSVTVLVLLVLENVNSLLLNLLSKAIHLT